MGEGDSTQPGRGATERPLSLAVGDRCGGVAGKDRVAELQVRLNTWPRELYGGQAVLGKYGTPGVTAAAASLTLWAGRGGPPFLGRTPTSPPLKDATEASPPQDSGSPPSSCTYFLSCLLRTMMRVEFQTNLAGDMLDLVRGKETTP